MAALTPTSFTALFMIYVFLSVPGSYAVTFTIVNKCSYTVWPAILSAAAAGALLRPTTGFALQPGDSNTVHMPPAWSGKLWGRTLCSHNFAGKFSCVTGDCGSSTVECGGDGNPALPVTLTEFTLNGTDGLDYFDVSLVDGFNLPVRVEPQGGTGAGNCRATSCPRNLNKKCPIELKVMVDGERVVACKSACQAEACNSTLLSQFFKSKCPHARVYAYDHGSFTCASADYSITFCPYGLGPPLLLRQFSANGETMQEMLLTFSLSHQDIHICTKNKNCNNTPLACRAVSSPSAAVEKYLSNNNIYSSTQSGKAPHCNGKGP